MFFLPLASRYIEISPVYAFVFICVFPLILPTIYFMHKPKHLISVLRDFNLLWIYVSRKINDLLFRNIIWYLLFILHSPIYGQLLLQTLLFFIKYCYILHDNRRFQVLVFIIQASPLLWQIFLHICKCFVQVFLSLSLYSRYFASFCTFVGQIFMYDSANYRFYSQVNL